MKAFINVKIALIGAVMRKDSEHGDLVKLIHRDLDEGYIVIKYLSNNKLQIIKFKDRIRTVFFEQ